MEMSGTAYCPHCGAEAQADSIFCSGCSRPLVSGAESSAPAPYLISPGRILFMSFLSFGLYLFYWLYKTWKQYHDHTGVPAHPIAHGLTGLVPIYGSFRAHAHLRTFGELASRAGLELRLNPRLAFIAVLSGWVLSFVAGGVSSVEFVPVLDPLTGDPAIDPVTGAVVTEVINPTRSELIMSLFLRMASIIAGVWMVLHAQPRINYYWDQMYGSRLRGVALGKGEVIVGAVGVFAWTTGIFGILSAQ